MIIKLTIPDLADSLVIPLENTIQKLNKEIVDLNESYLNLIDNLNSEHELEVQNLNDNIESLNNTITEKDGLIELLNETIDYYQNNRFLYIIDINNYLLPIPNLVGDYPMILIVDNQNLGRVNIDISHYGNYNHLNTLNNYISLINRNATIFLYGEITLDLLNCREISKLIPTLAGGTYGANREIIPLIVNLNTSDKLTSLAYAFESTNRHLTKISISNTHNVTDLDRMFYNSQMVNLDLSECDFTSSVQHRYLFYGCNSLENLNCPSLKNSKPTNNSGMFNYCTKLKEFPIPNLSKTTDVTYMFSGCESLEELGDLNTEVCTNFNYMFSGCTKLVKVASIDMNKASGYSLGCNNIRYLIIKNIVSTKGITQVPFLWDYWGVEDESIPLSKGARQSLIDTFTKYSFDRATADYPACRIILSKTSLDLFTEEEIAQATARGYTLLAY